MLRMLLRLILNAIALAVATWLVGGIYLSEAELAQQAAVLLFVALIFGTVNAILKPMFRKFASPLIWLTLGFLLWVINALLLLLTSWISSRLNLGWNVDGFGSAMLGALIVSVVSFVLNLALPEPRRES